MILVDHHHVLIHHYHRRRWQLTVYLIMKQH